MKRVLIITYYWPPSGGVGVQRWLKFAKYLPEFGIKPIIFAPENPNYPIIDKNLSFDSDKIKVIKLNIWEPYRLASIFSKKNKTIQSGLIEKTSKQSILDKISLFVRGNFFIPDSRKFWIKPSIKYLHKYLTDSNIETIITTGPPHSIHLIGLGLKEKLGINWIADFRDPWTNISYHSKLKLTNNSKKKHIKLEKKVLDSCDKIIVTNNGDKRDFESKTSTKIEVITNGFDGEMISKINLDKNFSIGYTGVLETLRNPTILWDSLEELCKEDEAFNKKLELKFTGKISDSVINDLKKYNLFEKLKLTPYIPHREISKTQSSSQILLLSSFKNKRNKGIIPAKLFEYLKAKRPIIAFGIKKSHLEKILIETNSGELFSHKKEEKNSIKKFISHKFELYKQQKLFVKQSNTSQYHRKNLTEKLAKTIKKLP